MKLLTGVGIVLLLSSLLTAVLIYEKSPSDFNSELFNPVVFLLTVGAFTLGVLSFCLTEIPLSRIHVRVIAVAFLILALSVPVASHYAGQVAKVSGTSGTPPWIVSGSISVPSVSGNGIVSMELQDLNPDNASITAVYFTNEGLSNVMIIPNISSLELMYQGRQVSSVNPLPVGASAIGSLKISNVTDGMTYEINVKATFQNGAYDVQMMTITAGA
jgi:hypothetical protein